jgi:hypothetical protein
MNTTRTGRGLFTTKAKYLGVNISTTYCGTIISILSVRKQTTPLPSYRGTSRLVQTTSRTNVSRL